MLTGQCACGALTYQMASEPIFVHCCHCSECQRQTGSAFVLNAIIETDRVTHRGPVFEHSLPTPSGKGQVMTRCNECSTVVFSKYMARQGKLTYIRVGTLDDPSACPPNVQIFTSSKQPWVTLNPDIPIFEEFYKFDEVWPEAALNRMNTAFGAT